MTDDMFSPGIFFVGIFCSLVFGIVVFIIVGAQNSHRRDLFLSYCTSHGDKYEVCVKAWEEGEMK